MALRNACRQRCGHGLFRPTHRRGFASSGLARYSGPAGQDLGEHFAVYAAPPPANRASGFICWRGLDALDLHTEEERGVVHRDGLWHRSAHIWVTDGSAGKIVVQQRSLAKDTNPGLWDVSVAGHITAGDCSLETAARECEEELGLAIRPPTQLRYLFTAISCQQGTTATHGDYACNEYQDVFATAVSGMDDSLLQSLTVGATEVAAVKLMKPAALQSVLLARHHDFVYHSPAYVGRLFRELGC
eukprot:SAG22_NODE_3892_length_1480_cov_2.062274_2_plen_244_part_00